MTIVSGGKGVRTQENAKPLIVNGSMDVAQRGTSKTSASGYTTVDRFRNFLDDGVVTATQESLTSGNAFINGFANAFKLDVTTADGTVANNHIGGIQYKFEGQDLQVFKKGTANAEKFTVAFWIKSTKTGTYICELEDEDNSRNNSQSYTVSSSNTWEHKVVNFPADTTGAFGDDSGNSLKLNWFIMAGTDYTSGTLQEAWGSETAANRCVGQVNALDNTSNNIHITGVQMEVGEYSSTTLPPFQHESFGDNLTRCMRYYYRATGRCGFGAGTGFVQDGAVKGYIYHTMPVAPRAEMSFSLSGTSAAILSIDGNAGDDVQSIAAAYSDVLPFKDYEFNFVTDGSSITDKCGMGIRVNASNYIECSAEL